ncbi:MAG: YbaN family protein [Bacteroidaceae bacterium]|nr:YbaN family protein [Bacteroidaceae bacterium]
MKLLYLLLGTLSLILGIIGIFLPVLPTTPLLLLTAFCYYRGSSRMYDWLMSHPKLGPYIRNFREHRMIPRRVKAYILTMLWLSLLFCAYILHPIWLKCLMIAIAIGVTIHILSYKSE